MKSIFEMIKTVLFSILFFFPTASFSATGGFIVRNQGNMNTIKIVGRTELTASKMKDLYSSGLYKSFYRVLKLKGFEEYFIPRLFCIAKMESSFNPAAKNVNKNGTVDVGLFQINSVWKRSCKNPLYGIEANIDCAKTVLETQGLKSWVTYHKHGKICEESLEM